MPDTDYIVVAKVGGGFWHTATVHINGTENLSASTFRISIGNPGSIDTIPANTLQIKWQAFKLMTDAALLANETKIDQNTSDIATNSAAITALEEQVALSGSIYIIANNKVLGSTSSDSYTYTPSVNGIFKAYGFKVGSGNTVHIQKGTGTTWSLAAGDVCPGAQWDDYPTPIPQYVSDNGGSVTDCALHSWYIQGFAEKGVTYRLLTNDTEHKFTLTCWSFFATK